MSEPVSFIVPLVPPSVNHYIKHTKTGRHYPSKEGLEFKKQVSQFSRGKQIRAKHYEVRVLVYLGYKMRGDADNFWKCILDGLVECGVIDSDAKVSDLILRKRRDPDNPRTLIVIQEAS